MTEQELLVDCLKRLNRTELDYMLTGSMVSNYWGIPRTTHDLDFVIQLPPTSIPRLMDEFRNDFHLNEASVRAAHQPPYQFNAIDTRSALKVDFWMLQNKPLERTMFSRRVRVSLFGEFAWICTAEDVILHKLYWNTITPSDRQLLDAAGVVAIQSGALDLTYLRHWASELNVTSTLEDLLAGKIRPKET
jgi:hypothetical protein